jgi:hypothetical protein
MQRAIAEGADYIGVGPVYEPPTKPGKAPAGLAYVRYASEHSKAIAWKSSPFIIGGAKGPSHTAGCPPVVAIDARLRLMKNSQGSAILPQIRWDFESGWQRKTIH